MIYHAYHRFPHFLRLAMSYRKPNAKVLALSSACYVWRRHMPLLWNGNVASDGGYRHVAPHEV